MPENNPLNDILVGIGCLCEMAGLVRTNLMNNGYTREEACQISKEIVLEAFRNDGKK